MAMASNRKRAPGSTKLHMDLADAINFMPWASPNLEGKDGTAAWDIYRAEDSEKVRIRPLLCLSRFATKLNLDESDSRISVCYHQQDDTPVALGHVEPVRRASRFLLIPVSRKTSFLTLMS